MSNIRRPKEGRDMQEERTRTSLPGWLDGLYDPDEMRAADRFAMERRGILELELAEKAGAGLAAAAAGAAGGGPIRVVVGPGNNGGDGLISARLLREAGHEVDVMAPLALDGLAGVPSGVNAATGEVEGPAIRASVTTTNHAPKIGLYVAPGARHVGEVRVIDIGIPRGAPDAGLVGLISRRVLRLVPARPRYASLRDTVLVVGGARGSTGAPAMAAEAAMRAGTCYVRAAVPASVAPFMDLRLPGALIHGLEEEGGRHVEAGAPTSADLAPDVGAVVLGPGLGGAEGGFSRALASSIEVPMVIEAGGLSAYPSVEAFSEHPSPTVLISDEAGFGRLLGLSPEEVGARRLASARALVDRAGAVAVLEGDGCVVAAPGGPVALGPGASGALAANGTGSVLAGVVGGVFGRGVGPSAAAPAAGGPRA